MLLRVPVRISRGVHVLIIIIYVIFSSRVASGRAYACHGAANGHRRDGGIRRGNVARRRTTVARSPAGDVKVMGNINTLNILDSTPPKGTPTAMRRRYSRRRRVTEARAGVAVSGRNGHGRARGSPGATGSGGPTQRKVFGATPALRLAAKPPVRARRASTSNMRGVADVPGGGQDRGLGGDFEGWGGQTQGRLPGSMAVPRDMPESATS